MRDMEKLLVVLASVLVGVTLGQRNQQRINEPTEVQCKLDIHYIDGLIDTQFKELSEDRLVDYELEFDNCSTLYEHADPNLLYEKASSTLADVHWNRMSKFLYRHPELMKRFHDEDAKQIGR